MISEAGSKPYLLLFLFLPNLYDLHFLACPLNLLLELFPFISLIFPLHIQTVCIIVTTHIHIIYSSPGGLPRGVDPLGNRRSGTPGPTYVGPKAPEILIYSKLRASFITGILANFSKVFGFQSRVLTMGLLKMMSLLSFKKHGHSFNECSKVSSSSSQNLHSSLTSLEAKYI